MHWMERSLWTNSSICKNTEENMVLCHTDPVLCLPIIEMDFKSTIVVMEMHINTFIFTENLYSPLRNLKTLSKWYILLLFATLYFLVEFWRVSTWHSLKVPLKSCQDLTAAISKGLVFQMVKVRWSARHTLGLSCNMEFQNT